MKNQVLFSSKDKSKNLKCCLLQFLFGPLRVKYFCFLNLLLLRKPQDFLENCGFSFIFFVQTICWNSGSKYNHVICA